MILYKEPAHTVVETSPKTCSQQAGYPAVMMD